MRTLVVYESMYGNTRQVAEAIARGARAGGEASVLHVTDVNPDALDSVGLLVVGAPTHAWSLPRPSTRHSAVRKPNPGSPYTELSAEGPGVRELLDRLPRLDCPAAAFDTRFGAPALFTGRASRAINRGLRRHGATLVGQRQSFLVTKANRLRTGQLERAEAWGRALVGDRRNLVGRHR